MTLTLGRDERVEYTQPRVSTVHGEETSPTFSNGRYVAERFLGQGALSEVFRVRGEESAPRVLKRMHAHCADDPSLVEMFEHEASVLHALSHPGIPRIHERGVEGRRPWMVIDFVEGVPLDQVIPSPIGDGPAAALALGLLDVLEHVHARRAGDGGPLLAVHRDVAPGNVMVTGDGGVVLVDFGIATSRWRRDPDRGVMKGTRGYMAPEVVTGERDADNRSDLWAVGVLLYELALGCRLFGGPLMAVLSAIAEAKVPPPGELRPDFPEGLARVLVRALARDPDARFAFAREMAAALEGEAVTAGLDLSRESLARSVRRASVVP